MNYLVSSEPHVPFGVFNKTIDEVIATWYGGYMKLNGATLLI